MGRGREMKKYLWVWVLLFVLVWSPVQAQEPDQTSLLVVTVLWDSNYDGVEEGVGPNIPVWVGKAGSETLSFTDKNSQVAYFVQYGAWFARAEVPQTRAFFYWVCGTFIVVDEKNELLEIHCYERFRIKIPFLSKG